MWVRAAITREASVLSNAFVAGITAVTAVVLLMAVICVNASDHSTRNYPAHHGPVIFFFLFLSLH